MSSSSCCATAISSARASSWSSRSDAPAEHFVDCVAQRASRYTGGTNGWEVVIILDAMERSVARAARPGRRPVEDTPEGPPAVSRDPGHGGRGFHRVSFHRPAARAGPRGTRGRRLERRAYRRERALNLSPARNSSRRRGRRPRPRARALAASRSSSTWPRPAASGRARALHGDERPRHGPAARRARERARAAAALVVASSLAVYGEGAYRCAGGRRVQGAGRRAADGASGASSRLPRCGGEVGPGPRTKRAA